MTAVVEPVADGFGWRCSACGRSAGLGQMGPLRAVTLLSGEQLTAEQFADRAAANHDANICTKRSTR